jgi:hypothetical protein
VAFDDANGSLIWSRNLGTPLLLSQLLCGDNDPLGRARTPATPVVYLDATATPDDGTTKRHRIFAVSLEDGSTITGWPFDVEGVMSAKRYWIRQCRTSAVRSL